jgi:DNA invertase Pin-like site-specific DNA recombinase
MAKRARPGDPLRVVAYLRRSTNKQALSPEAQRAAIGAWCEARGARVVAWHEEQLSGATPLAARPAFVAALASLAEHRAGVLLVAKRDRLARDMFSMLTAEHAAEERGARVLSAHGEGSEAADPLERRLRDLVAEDELRKVRERTRAALAVKRARGEKTGGDAPYGFRRVIGADGVARLELEPAEQAALARARALRADGVSYARIARQLGADGHAPRGNRWHETHVRRVLLRAG